MDPTLRQLEYLVAVADHGSFRAAARACAVSQPGLSSQIQQLEGVLGLRVFERDRRKVLVTPGGEVILGRAREVLAAAENLVEAARVHSRPLVGRLRLGVIPTVAPYLLPRVLPRIRRRHRELVCQLHEGRTADLLAGLRRGKLDLLLLALEADLGRVETLPLFRDPFVAALPPDHRWAGRKRLARTDLAGEPMLLLDDGHCLRDQTLEVCDRAGAPEAADFRASSLPTLVQMVAAGSGMTLLPELAVRVEGRHARLALVPFGKPVPHRTIGLAWRPSSPRADEFRVLGELMKAAADS